MVRRKFVGKYRRNSDDFTVNRNVVGNSSEYSDQLPTTTTVTFFIGMSSKSRRKIPTTLVSSEFRRKWPTEFRRLHFLGFGQKLVSNPSQMSDDIDARRNLRRNSACFLVVLKTSIDTHHETESDTRAEDIADFGYLRADEFVILSDSEGQAHASDVRVIHIYKDVEEIIAKARESGNLLSQQNKTKDLASIDRRGQPSIDGHNEFRKRAYYYISIKKIQWETRDEYGIYRDEHGHARAVDGRIIHVSRKYIMEIMERAAMDGHHSYLFSR
ncbi:hypothetical protein F2Q70_00004572 [Brassica cretica]|uniref:Uncharacterized protein n=1 Tax=Brassica cretica TaxID=69181 RepID=A0A8S9IQX2_BRACR|nr:hypothetical protein F2Q70_00004572 [Brassica cretica]KAF3565029.1 hypothetical protein DY000_02016669 [Brassica cretica]